MMRKLFFLNFYKGGKILKISSEFFLIPLHIYLLPTWVYVSLVSSDNFKRGINIININDESKLIILPSLGWTTFNHFTTEQH